MFNIFKRNKKEIKKTEVEEPVVIHDNFDKIDFDFNKFIIKESVTYLKDLSKCNTTRYNTVLVGETGMIYVYYNDEWYRIGKPIPDTDLTDDSFIDIYIPHISDLDYVIKEPKLIVKVIETKQCFICKDDEWKLLGRITN